MVLGREDLQEGQLNTWEAEPVTSAEPRVALVYQWIPGDKEGTGSTVTLTGLSDGEHELLLKARDRAGNLSPSSLRVNWTVDTMAPSNCSISSFNGVVVPGWTPQLSLHRPVNSSVADVVVAVSSDGAGSPLAGVEYSWRSSVGAVAGAAGAGAGAGGGSARQPESSGGYPVSLQQLSDGQHELFVYGEDEAGNRSPRPCANLSWTVDRTSPVRRQCVCCWMSGCGLGLEGGITSQYLVFSVFFFLPCCDRSCKCLILVVVRT